MRQPAFRVITMAALVLAASACGGRECTGSACGGAFSPCARLCEKKRDLIQDDFGVELNGSDPRWDVSCEPCYAIFRTQFFIDPGAGSGTFLLAKKMVDASGYSCEGMLYASRRRVLYDRLAARSHEDVRERLSDTYCFSGPISSWLKLETVRAIAALRAALAIDPTLTRTRMRADKDPIPSGPRGRSRRSSVRSPPAPRPEPT